MADLNRRGFGKGATALGASLLITGTRASGNIVRANDRLRIAVAGLNGRGKSHISGWLDQENVEIAYLIDPDQNVLDRSLKNLEEKSKGRFKTVGVRDVRTALEDKTLDAISVATPNHWHSLITIWAAQAGKHVYVEKPMSHDVHEGSVVLAAQKKYGVVIQHGTQSRSDAKRAGLHVLFIRISVFIRLSFKKRNVCKSLVRVSFCINATLPRKRRDSFCGDGVKFYRRTQLPSPTVGGQSASRLRTLRIAG
ncbi:MAG: Gfo/Idh/MocA family oxidoreductase [Planctomycetota bacterium]|nr:Gfo/Idh/MocA family oxidoreductase [Planctomycetota bacterium]